MSGQKGKCSIVAASGALGGINKAFRIEIEMQIGDSGSYNQNLTLELAGGQQLDVVSTLFAGYSNLVNQGYLMDLEQNAR